jgi:hypothetical protein
MFGFLTNLVVGGPGTLGFTGDVLTAVGIFLVLDILGVMILMSNASVKEKFSVLGTPLAILFVGLVIGISKKLP